MQARYLNFNAPLWGLTFTFMVATVPNPCAADCLPKETLGSRQQVIKAWQEAGAELFWTSVGQTDWEHVMDSVDDAWGDLPVFWFPYGDAATLARLPAPPFPFGLELPNERITDADLKYLARLKSLCVLRLGNWETLRPTAVTDAGLKELAKLPNLQQLGLSNHQLTGTGLRHLAGLKHLRVLDLSNTPLTEAGMKCLATLQGLRVLDVFFSFMWLA